MSSQRDNPAAALPRGRLGRLADRRAAHRLRSILCLDDFEPAARRRLPRPIFGYVDGAAETNASLADNQAALADFALVPRILTDVSRRSRRRRFLGREWENPFGIPPMGLAAMMTHRGDIALAEAAGAAGIPMGVSGAGLIALEDIARANSDAWFQLYVPGDEARIDAMLDRVEAAGYETLILTVDVPTSPNRENNVRNGFSTPLRPGLRLAFDGAIRPEWVFGTLLRTLRDGMPHFENGDAHRGAPLFSRSAARNFDRREELDWRHFERMRRRWKGRLAVKGILHPADAARAAESGADAIILSNHGGRQLDGAIAGLRVLPEIRAALGRRVEIAVDGGMRRGTDILKALALGADFVFVGRPFLYAAAVAGRAGIDHAIALLAAEVDRDMALMGITRLDALDETAVRPLR